MSAESLNCPMCGASVKSDLTVCAHCGTRLATVSCPSCFGLMFLGAKFCSHCGARADRAELASTTHACPRCEKEMNSVAVGNMHLVECPGCQGIWVDTLSMEQICADKEKQAAVLGSAAPVPDSGVSVETRIRYLPCPVCRKLMNRVNFARCSNVIVDVCKGHGTWFDRDELRKIIEYIRKGGLEVTRSREAAEMEEKRSQLKASRVADAWHSGTRGGYGSSDYEFGIFSAAKVIRDLFR